MEPWALNGGPDEETLRRLVEDEHKTDSEIAELYGARRQTAAYWRMKIGIPRSANGSGKRTRRREMVSHKWLIHWRVRSDHMNDPIRKRLVDYSLRRQGVQLAPDAEGRVDEFVANLNDLGIVVSYDPEHTDGEGVPAPFFFVPRCPDLDAVDDIVRR